jgi:deoxyribose-phosphate aldolase
MVAVAVASLPSGFTVASVAGFPSGAHEAVVKAREAELARDHGAREIDMVVNLGAVMGGRWAAVTDEIASVRRAVGAGVIVKVIVESAALDDGQIVAACTAAVDAGADFVKTSTGFHKSGGATSHAVRLMRATVGPQVGVKASGGIRTLDVALQMIDAGATRLGTSSARAILDEAARTNAPGNS